MGLLVHAESQTQGRGRAGRTWLSNDNSLTFSLVLREGVVASRAPHYSFIAGLGVRRALGESAQLKWPNDLWIDGKKVGGVLASLEMRPLGIVIGVGLNTGFDPTTAAPELAEKASALPAAKNRAGLLADILMCIEAQLTLYDRLGPAATLAELRSVLALLGQRIRVRTDSAIVDGIMRGVTDDFALRLETESGEQTLSLGDVWPIETNADPHGP